MKTKSLLILLVVLAATTVIFAQEPPTKLRVSQGVMAGLVIRKVPAAYPQEAKDAHIQGDAIVQATIDREGNVSGVKPLSGHPLFMDAATKAVKQWKFKPYLLNGDPVEVETTIRIQFHM